LRKNDFFKLVKLIIVMFRLCTKFLDFEWFLLDIEVTLERRITWK